MLSEFKEEVIGRDDLLTNNLASPRPKDMVDVEVLQEQIAKGR